MRFAGAFRRFELGALDADDITDTDEGCASGCGG
jgi:hypothetical protein